MAHPVQPVTFVVCCNNRPLLEKNLLASPCLQGEHPHQVVILDDSPSAAHGFHLGLSQAIHDIVVWVHQDVFLPGQWDIQFQGEVARVKTQWKNIGVIGLYGRRNQGELTVGEGHVVDRGTTLVGNSPLPCLVDSLDEVLLAFPRTTPIRMDEKLGYHLYGSDVVLTARGHGLAAVVVDAPVHHNSLLNLQEENTPWWQQVAVSCGHFEEKWHTIFPYHSTCFSFSPHTRLGDHLQQGLVKKNGQTVFNHNHALWQGLIRAFPLRMNLGSGSNNHADYLNVDINGHWQPDLVLDISKPLTLPCLVRSQRFGEFALRPGMFKEIFASHLLEHIPDLVTAMTNCLTLLQEGGVMKIAVPYDLSCGAWQDPTHVRAFNENSWLYYTEWHWYLGWQVARFDLMELTVGMTSFGQGLAAKGVSQEEILRTPRAVDEIAVVLKKRLLPVQEQGSR